MTIIGAISIHFAIGAILCMALLLDETFKRGAKDTIEGSNLYAKSPVFAYFVGFGFLCAVWPAAIYSALRVKK